MEKINSPESEEVILKIIIARHGPKLSAAGEKNALAEYFSDSVKDGFKDMNIEDGTGLVHVATSPVKRAIDTAQIHLGELNNTEHRNKNRFINQESLEVLFQPIQDAKDRRYAQDLDTIIMIQKKLEPEIRKKIEEEFPNFNKNDKEAEIRNRIDMIVLEKMFSDEEIQNNEDKIFKTSYTELADKFAKRYLDFAKHIGILKNKKDKSETQDSSEPYIQIDISHSFPITSFLKKYLVFDDGVEAQKLNTQEFFRKTGGIIRESGSFNMDYVISNGKKIVRVEGEFEKGKKFSGIIDLNK